MSPIAALTRRVLRMAQARKWDLHWSTRGVYLHLEASELIEASRGKGCASVTSEAADVLLTLMLLTESQGISFDEVLDQVEATCAKLETKPPYEGEDSLEIRQQEAAPTTVSVLSKESLALLVETQRNLAAAAHGRKREFNAFADHHDAVAAKEALAVCHLLVEEHGGTDGLLKEAANRFTGLTVGPETTVGDILNAARSYKPALDE